MKGLLKTIIIVVTIICFASMSYANLWDNFVAWSYRDMPIDGQINACYSIKNIETKDGDPIIFGDYSLVLFGNKWKGVEYPKTDFNHSAWNIVYKDNGIAMLISTFIIDYKQYDENLQSVTWEDSSLRKWLNGDFYNTVFNQEDKDKIIKYEKTDDRVFILSADEIDKYFPSNKLANFKDGKTFSVDKYTFSSTKNSTSFSEIMNNLVIENDKLAVEDAYSYWLRDSNNEIQVLTASRDILKCNANKFSGVRPAIIVKYDVDATELTDLLDSNSYGLFDTVRDKALPDIFNDVFDVFTKIFKEERD